MARNMVQYLHLGSWNSQYDFQLYQLYPTFKWKAATIPAKMVNHDISPWSRTCHKSPLRWQVSLCLQAPALTLETSQALGSQDPYPHDIMPRHHGAKAGMENPTPGAGDEPCAVLGRISYNLPIQKKELIRKKIKDLRNKQQNDAKCKFYGASNLQCTLQ